MSYGAPASHSHQGTERQKIRSNDSRVPLKTGWRKSTEGLRLCKKSENYGSRNLQVAFLEISRRHKACGNQRSWVFTQSRSVSGKIPLAWALTLEQERYLWLCCRADLFVRTEVLTLKP